jgi:hypothetical protein
MLSDNILISSKGASVPNEWRLLQMKKNERKVKQMKKWKERRKIERVNVTQL